MSKKQLDGLSFHGAATLADTIEEFWRSRGHAEVIAWRYELPGYRGVYGVRSNLVAGRPEGNQA